MLEVLLESILFPAAIAVILLLCPRLPWSVDAGRRMPVWTGGLALCTAFLISLAMVEGPDIWQLSQRWYWLWASALIVAVATIFSQTNSSQLSKGTVDSLPLRDAMPFCIASMLALFILRMPNHETLWIRTVVAVAGGVAVFLMVKPSLRFPIMTPAALGASFLSLAVLLAGSGSMKLGIVAMTLGLTAIFASSFAIIGNRFSSGSSFATVAITISIALAFYGVSYHDDLPVSVIAWTALALAPIIMALATRSRTRAVPITALIAVVIVCLVTIIVSFRSLNALDSQRMDGASLTQSL